MPLISTVMHYILVISYPYTVILRFRFKQPFVFFQKSLSVFTRLYRDIFTFYQNYQLHHFNQMLIPLSSKLLL